MPHLHVNDINLYYEWQGDETKDLMILNNGIFMSVPSWAFQTPDLAKHFRILAYDMRGQGRSDHPDGPYDMDLHAQDLLGLMDALGIERAHMVGTSYGGELNLYLGIHHPERCRSLTVIASVSHSETLLHAVVERWRQAALLGDGELFFTLIYADVYSQGFLDANPEMVPVARKRYADLDLAAAVRLIESYQRFDVRQDLHRIQIPTCIVAAELDLLKPRRYSDFMHQEIAGSEYHLIPNAGHVVVMEQPGAVNSIIIGFLTRQR
ncbi:MAG: alpha/beta fold hydrolase, partial [Caldilineaceae bacterium]|nr:alpha/beta fold hydrolase [Caldilineaceae bacterium]MBP8108270.1 alpha/beta fold hydrolase [Caldilineaceae bacterium]MBP8123139.1 alpha/beta fold hydrolase [Caldilineaceae bacterium]MBP9073513.1 alpha/beta fold hydrolase [Caldilineaceae bacterium]